MYQFSPLCIIYFTICHGGMHLVKKNIEAFIVTSKAASLKENAQETKYEFVSHKKKCRTNLQLRDSQLSPLKMWQCGEIWEEHDQINVACTRVGTLIVATIYLQLIQNRYMFQSFTVLHCSHQHCVQPVASDVDVVGYLQQGLLC